MKSLGVCMIFCKFTTTTKHINADIKTHLRAGLLLVLLNKIKVVKIMNKIKAEIVYPGLKCENFNYLFQLVVKGK